jgi:hypothetical protein
MHLQPACMGLSAVGRRQARWTNPHQKKVVHAFPWPWKAAYRSLHYHHADRRREKEHEILTLREVAQLARLLLPIGRAHRGSSLTLK